MICLIYALPFLFFASTQLFAQGGPPMITDDPGTPGNGHWENNFSLDMNRIGTSTVYDVPHADINYGWGDRLQLKAELPWSLHALSGAALQGGVGNLLLGVKWRFIDGGDSGLAISTYPQIEITLSQSSVDREIAEHAPSVFLPLSFAHHFGSIETNLQAGVLARNNDAPHGVIGIVAGRTFGERLELLAELHDETSPELPVMIALLGARYQCSSSIILLFSAGKGIGNSPESPSLLVYGGVQWLAE